MQPRYHSTADSALHTPLKVTLFIRIQEMQTLLKRLGEINLLSEPAKKRWAKENKDYLHEALLTFGEYLPVDLDEDEMDTQLIHLVSEYTSTLRQVLDLSQLFFMPLTKAGK